MIALIEENVEKTEAFLKKNGITHTENYSDTEILALDGYDMRSQLLELRESGVDIARLSAALSAFLSGADAGSKYIAADAGENAAANDSLNPTLLAINSIDIIQTNSEVKNQFYDGLSSLGLSSEQIESLLKDQAFKDEVLVNLIDILNTYPHRSFAVQANNDSSILSPIKLFPNSSADQAVLESLSKMSKYLEENSEKAKYIEYAFYVAQVPKGAISYALDQVIANSPL